MKIALVHDYLNEFGGAERVLEALCEIWPNAPIYTAFYRAGSSAHKRFKDKKIITSWAQNVPFFAKYLHSPLRFLAPLIWNSFDFSNYDVVISSSSWYVTKGFKRRLGDRVIRSSGRKKVTSNNLINRKPDNPVEICYCHTPPRYLYGYPTASDFQKYWLVRVYAALVNHYMRVYDFEAAQRPASTRGGLSTRGGVDWFIANSYEVQSRIKKFYRRDSVVIYPPVDVERFARLTTKDQRLTRKSNGKKVVLDVSRSTLDNYFLVVSRLVGAKNIGIAVEVCTNLKLNLKIVGTGRETDRLEELAGNHNSVRHSRPDRESDSRVRENDKNDRIEFLGDVSDDELAKLYQGCRALIFPASQEDFGIVPVEAMAAGKPVIALDEGGVKETVIDGKTGLLVEDLAPGAFVIAINRFMEMEKKGQWDSKFIQKHAEKFSKERFKREIKAFVKSKMKDAKF